MPGQGNSAGQYLPQALQNPALGQGLVGFGQQLAQAGAPSPYKQSFMGGLAQGAGGFAQGLEQYKAQQMQDELFRMKQAEAALQTKKLGLDTKKLEREESQDAAYEAGAAQLPPPPGVDPNGWASLPAKEKFATWTNLQQKAAEQNISPDQFSLWFQDYKRSHNGQNPTMADIENYRQSGGASTKIDIHNPQTPALGPIPEAMMAVPAPGGGWTMAPVPGGPVAKALEFENQNKQVSTDVVADDINRTLQTMSNAILPTTGFIGEKVAKIGGTAAHDVSSTIQTIRSNVTIDKLNAMRKSSPTGGALGSITEGENKMLGSALGSLEQSQTEAQLQYNLKRVYNMYMDIVHGRDGGPQRYDLGTPAPGPSAPSNGSAVIDGYTITPVE